MRFSTLVTFMLPFSALAAPTIVKRQSQSDDLVKRTSDSIFKSSDSINVSPNKVISPSSQDKIEKRQIGDQGFEICNKIQSDTEYVDIPH